MSSQIGAGSVGLPKGPLEKRVQLNAQQGGGNVGALEAGLLTNHPGERLVEPRTPPQPRGPSSQNARPRDGTRSRAGNDTEAQHRNGVTGDVEAPSNECHTASEDLLRDLREQSRRALDGMIVWAGLIAAAAFTAYIQYPPGAALDDGSGAAAAAISANSTEINLDHHERAFLIYVYADASAFFLASSAIIMHLISTTKGYRVSAVLTNLWWGVKGTRVGQKMRRTMSRRAQLPGADRVHVRRGVAFLLGMGSMVTLAGLALGAAFLSAGYLSFGQRGSLYRKHFYIVSILGWSVLTFFAVCWLLCLLCFFFVPDKFLEAPTTQKSLTAKPSEPGA